MHKPSLIGSSNFSRRVARASRRFSPEAHRDSSSTVSRRSSNPCSGVSRSRRSTLGTLLATTASAASSTMTRPLVRWQRSTFCSGVCRAFGYCTQTGGVLDGRLVGFKKGLKKRRAECQVFDVRDALAHPERYRERRLPTWLKNQPGPLGLFCMNDRHARELSQECTALGLRVPEKRQQATHREFQEDDGNDATQVPGVDGDMKRVFQCMCAPWVSHTHAK